MIRRLFYGFVWITFILYAFFGAPPNQPDTLTLITDLSTGQWEHLNPWVVSLFNGMGLWPMIYCALLLRDGQRQPFPAWPFAIASFFVGAFAILLYLALRESSPQTGIVDPTPIKFWESRGLGIGLSMGVLALFGYGLSQGSWGDFIQEWYSNRFVHVMSLDFCLLSLLIPSLSIDDRELRPTQGLVWLDFIPVVGALVYLCRRPPISSHHSTEQPL